MVDLRTATARPSCSNSSCFSASLPLASGERDPFAQELSPAPPVRLGHREPLLEDFFYVTNDRGLPQREVIAESNDPRQARPAAIPRDGRLSTVLDESMSHRPPGVAQPPLASGSSPPQSSSRTARSRSGKLTGLSSTAAGAPRGGCC